MLGKITKELNTYLENTRAKFARFYFLSNDQLLHILSQVKEVERVQEHLRSIFENIAKLEFAPDKTIKAMISVEDEKVQFKTILNPNGKQVEEWLGDVEIMMQASVRHVLLHSINTYPEEERVKWIFRQPGQCV
jgi:dynein heavy chain